MADTAIEWADKTWNPLLGCERVSAGCDGCYAISTATIRAGNPHPKVAAAFAGLTERRDGRLDWTGRINLLPERLNQPLHWRKPIRIFVNSQSDLFHKDVPDYFIAQVFAVMSVAHQHTFQLLTKRHGRMRSLLSSPEFHRLVADTAPVYGGGNPDLAQDYVTTNWPLPNVHVGVSVEDQKTADLRIPALLNTPAAVRWLSMEPLLGPVDLFGLADAHGHRGKPTHWLTGRPYWGAEETHPNGMVGRPLQVAPQIAWVVAGGETGAKSRPMRLDWIRTLRDQCRIAGVPFFFKQWGDWVPPSQMTEDTFMSWDVDNGSSAYDRDVPWRVGKKRAGRLLDERTWDEFPAERVAVTA